MLNKKKHIRFENTPCRICTAIFLSCFLGISTMKSSMIPRAFQVRPQKTFFDLVTLNFSKNIVSLVHHGAYCALVVHIAPSWCTSTPFTVVVVYNVP